MKEQSSQKPKEMVASSCCEAGSQLAWEPSVIDFIKKKKIKKTKNTPHKQKSNPKPKKNVIKCRLGKSNQG